MRRTSLRYSIVLVAAAVPLTVPPDEGDDPPAAVIVNDEGGPVTITGSVTYTDPLFLAGTAEPLVILEDQAGFVDRDRGFVMSEESQVIGQITSDVFTSPFTYSLSLPIEPEASLRDVDQDGETDEGVMVYAVAYWTNTWGDPTSSSATCSGGGWSTAYASTRIDPDPSAEGEVIGGTYLVFAPDDQQGFPSGFGDDGLLFTDDDPIVRLPQGYTVANLDTESVHVRSFAEVTIDLIEGEQAALEDFSDLSYTRSVRRDDRDVPHQIRLHRVQAPRLGRHLRRVPSPLRARPRRTATPRRTASRCATSPGRSPTATSAERSTKPRRRCSPKRPTVASGWRSATSTTVARSSTSSSTDGPADAAGIELRAEILEIDGRPIDDVVGETVPWSSPFSTEHVRRLQQLRYAIRFPVDTAVDITFQNPGDTEPDDGHADHGRRARELQFSSFNAGLTGVELPVEFCVLDSGYGYVLDLQLLRQPAADDPAVGADDPDAQRQRGARADHRHAPERRRRSASSPTRWPPTSSTSR